ncbi:MAG: 5-amino-6-(D-ribitylamino)uracil--L-tyrosine 4-hydroxyphenyl transferase CofH [Luminiphilus sp.]|nr:5-amino-6-(D-ribitylamino)uracil--L-tyrosine 4-hydroxyphenyl transferase CofH [Luminiphilus sp.]
MSVDSTTELAAIIGQARERRDDSFGRVITYSPKVFIPLTQLCRDVCHYCTFAQPPSRLKAAYMTLDEVLAVAREGQAAGCTEALLTLGEKPELRYKAAREWLKENGFSSTVEYVVAACKAIIKETNLIPHVNAGTLSRAELRQLRSVMGSFGLMLESGSPALLARDGAHFGSPDKKPWRRLTTLARAGRLKIPTTTGLLLGIGEDRKQRISDLKNIARLHVRYGHIQEVIIQNFRAKPGTRMASWPDVSVQDLLWTIAAARLILPADISIQAPPNLSPDDLLLLANSGLNDWGGVSPVTPDHVNPEAPWPEIVRLSAATEAAGKVLRARLPVYAKYLNDSDWLDYCIRPRCLEVTDSEGRVRSEQWRAGELGSDFPAVTASPALLNQDRKIQKILDRRRRGEALEHNDVVRLFETVDIDRQAVYECANELRSEQVGEMVTFVVNRNINYTNVCKYSCAFCAFSKGLPKSEGRERPYDISGHELARRASEAWSLGATEVCLQGGIHPGYDGNTYRTIVEAVKTAEPDMHVHAFSPLELHHGAETLGLDIEDYLRILMKVGLDTVPGTAAEILDDQVRAKICPDKLSAGQWLDTMAAAHRVGLRSTATIMFGHVDHAEHWATHLLAVRQLQLQTGGFTEFVPLPFVAREAPLYRRGLARPGPTREESRGMHAIARIILGDVIRNIQASWTKLGPAEALHCLNIGVNDLGGCLMNESISRAAGAGHGQCWSPAAMQSAILDVGRVPLQRTTLYGSPADERKAQIQAEPLQILPLEQPIAKFKAEKKLA